MSELDGNIPTDNMSDEPVTTDLLIKRYRDNHRKTIRYNTPNDIINDEWVVNPNNKNNLKYPNAKLHKRISFLKSFIRIVGCVFGVFGMFMPAVISIGVAEIIGIVEEMV